MRTIEEVVKEIEERLKVPAVSEHQKGWLGALKFILNFIKSDPGCAHLFSYYLNEERPGQIKFCAECGERLDYADNGKL